MSEMLEVVIDSVRVSLMSPQRVVVLKQRDKEKYLPIWVGSYEAEAITVALQEVEVARPLTQDLLKNIITVFGGTVLRVEVISLKDDIYFGNLVIEHDGKNLEIDCRPSDAIALAVRAHAPILVHSSVMDSAGITPEKDLQETDTPQAPPTAPVETPPSGEDSAPDEKRLDVFEDFLKKLGGEPGEDKPKEE